MRKHPQKYARDCLASITIGELVGGLAALDDSGATDDELCDYLDQEFLWGCWGSVAEDADRLFLADVRGLIVAALRYGRAH